MFDHIKNFHRRDTKEIISYFLTTKYIVYSFQNGNTVDYAVVDRVTGKERGGLVSPNDLLNISTEIWVHVGSYNSTTMYVSEEKVPKPWVHIIKYADGTIHVDQSTE